MLNERIKLLLGVQARVKHFETRFYGDFRDFDRDPHTVTVKGSPVNVHRCSGPL